MKQLLFLLLFPCLAMAQYQGNGNQKITLGEQTTADGLVFRGVASIDTVSATSKITRANKQDTSAYILLDTVTNLLWHYKIGSNAWTQAGGSTFDTTTLNLVSRFGLKLNISDTSSMLTNYYSAGRNGIIQAADVPTLNQNTTGSAATLTTGRTVQTNLASTSAATFNGSVNITPGVTGVLPVANGGTGASVKIFVDTFSTQTVNGLKTYGNIATFNDSIKVQGIKIGRGNVNTEDNLSIGVRVLTKNTTSGGGSSGLYNIAIGRDVLRETTTGNQNTAIGFNALRDNNTGSLNVALGVNAARFNTTGSNNFGLGTAALDQNTTGSGNVAIGRDAVRSNTTSNYNIGIGQGALDVSTGATNTAIGYLAGYGTGTNANTTGSNNTFIGNESVGASATASNVITLGNSSIATIRAQVTTITSLSDIRDKTDILPLNYGMNFIDKLKPVSFIWDMRDGGKIGIPEIGFIAQDLQQAQIDTGINIPNLVSGVEEKLEASYGVLLPIIVKALQEANEKIKSLEQRLLIFENK